MPVALSRDGAGDSSIVAGMAEGEAAEGTITLSFRLRSAGNSSLRAETDSVVLTWYTGLFDLLYTAQGCRVEDSLLSVLYSKTSTIYTCNMFTKRWQKASFPVSYVTFLFLKQKCSFTHYRLHVIMFR